MYLVPAQGLSEKLDQFTYGHHIIGGGAMWSERIPDTETLDRRFLPRGIAMAEVLWSNPAERDYDAFWERLQGQYSLLDVLGYGYDVEQVPVKLGTKNESFKEELKVIVTAEPAFANLQLAVEATTGITMGSAITFTERGLHQMKVQPNRGGHIMGKVLNYGFAVHEGLVTHSCLTSPSHRALYGHEGYPAG